MKVKNKNKQDMCSCPLCESELEIKIDVALIMLSCSGDCGWGSVPMPIKDLPEAFKLYYEAKSPENQRKESIESERAREIINKTYEMLMDKKRAYQDQLKLIKSSTVKCPYCGVSQVVHPIDGQDAQVVSCYAEGEDYRSIGCDKKFYVTLEIKSIAKVFTQDEVENIFHLVKNSDDNSDE